MADIADNGSDGSNKKARLEEYYKSKKGKTKAKTRTEKRKQ